MPKKLLCCLIASVIVYASHAQTTVQRNPEIEQMVQSVSADSLRSYVHSLVDFGTRHTMSSITKKQGIGAAREWVVAQFNRFAKQSNGRMTAFVDTITLQPDGKRISRVTNLGNAMAVIKGTDTADKRIFIMSGHLDSRVTDVMDTVKTAPGANDDASGVAAVMECARILSSHPLSATVILVAVSGEEQSLLGSGFLAQQAKSKGWQVEAMLNNDIVGSNNSSETNIIDNTRIRVFSEGLPAFETEKTAAGIRNYGLENDGKARQLARYVKEVGERYVDQLKVVMVYRNDRYLRGGDHTPFVQQGFAAVRLTEMNENFYHQHQDLRTENGIEYGDLEKFMDFEYLRKNTAVNLSVLANLAKAPSMPLEVKLETKNLTNYTILNWKAPATGKPIGYYVMMRETTSAQWEKKFFTKETSMHLPYSKDNYFFAVQAVDAATCESLPVVPLPAR